MSACGFLAEQSQREYTTDVDEPDSKVGNMAALTGAGAGAACLGAAVRLAAAQLDLTTRSGVSIWA